MTAVNRVIPIIVAAGDAVREHRAEAGKDRSHRKRETFLLRQRLLHPGQRPDEQGGADDADQDEDPVQSA